MKREKKLTGWMAYGHYGAYSNITFSDKIPTFCLILLLIPAITRSSDLLQAVKPGGKKIISHDNSLEPKEWREQITGIQFISIKGGCYKMGCDGWSEHCEKDEKPVHEVCVDDFWMGKYEVTQAQWKNLISENPSKFNTGQTYPVEMVSWHDAQSYIKKLNSIQKHIFRLPTEAEWEYAARSGGKYHTYANKGGSLNKVAWYIKNSNRSSHPTGTREPNKFGLYDMAGNVWEWCNDIYSANYYSASRKNNPQGPSTGQQRVIRGGSYMFPAKYCRTTNRGAGLPENFNSTLGFRLVVKLGKNNSTP
jgi:formylglycine-generating enzyme required for sulfatase activity